MNLNLVKLASAAIFTAVLTQAGQAHFLYASASPTQATFEFAESPGDDQLLDLAGKLDATHFSYYSDLGAKPTDLKPKSFGHISTAPIKEGIVAADLVYGILDRSATGRGIFRLEYFAKAAQTWEQTAKPIGQEYEIVFNKSGDKLQITPLYQGKSVESEVIIYRRGVADENLVFKGQPLEIPIKDLVAVRATHAIQKTGELEGKKYDLIRQYATLTVPAVADVPKGGDINAWYLLKQAQDSRESLQDSIAAVNGQVTVESNGKSVSVPFVYSFEKGLDFPGVTELPEEEAQRQIESMFSHRRGRAFALGDGKNPTVFTGDVNTVGTQIALQNDSNSTYRVKNNVITEVRRSTPTGYFIISILDTLVTKYDTTLSQLFTVTYFDKAGEIKIVETFQDSYTTVEGYYLPQRRTITTMSPNGAQTLTMTFSNQTLTLKQSS